MKMTLEERAAALKHSSGDLTEPNGSGWEAYWDTTRETNSGVMWETIQSNTHIYLSTDDPSIS